MPEGPATSEWSSAKRAAVAVLCVLALLAVSFVAGRFAMERFSSYSASTVTLNTLTPGGRQFSTNALTVTNSVEDNFSGQTGNLNGTYTRFNGGGGLSTALAPQWSAPTAFSRNSRAARTSGSGQIAALVPWLTRKTAVGVTTATFTTSTNVGVVSGSNSGGTTGAGVRIFYSSGNFVARIVRLTPGGFDDCGTAVVVGGNNTGGTRVIVLTFDPSNTGAGASATVQKTGGSGGTVNLTSTCDLSTANGSYAGLVSFSPNSTTYDNYTSYLTT